MVSKQAKENDAKSKQKTIDVDVLGEALESCVISKPPNVEDIDKDDRGNPQLCAEYVQDIYNYMRKLEVRMVGILSLALKFSISSFAKRVAIC